MKQSLRIAIAEDEPDMREYLEKTLPLLGHQVVASARTGRELIDACAATQPDLVLADIKMPEIDGIEASKEVCRTRPVPFILVSAHQEPELLERTDTDYILAYLVKPIKQSDLAPAITIAMRHHEQFNALKGEAANLRQALEDRKLVERAKGILMRRASVDEQEAFNRLRKTATERRQKLVEVAKMILAVEELSLPGESRTD
jgi:two-component system, response regulator PdtaR